MRRLRSSPLHCLTGRLTFLSDDLGRRLLQLRYGEQQEVRQAHPESTGARLQLLHVSVALTLLQPVVGHARDASLGALDDGVERQVLACALGSEDAGER